MGFVLSFITSILFTIYVLPKKLSTQSAVRYSLFQGVGYFFASAVVFAAVSLFSGNSGETLADSIHIISFIAGIVWFGGSATFLSAIDRIGLSRSNQWKNLQGPVGAVLSLTILGEAGETKVVFIILASLFILISAMLFTIKNEKEKAFDRSGIILALLAAVFFGTFSMLQKYVVNHGFIYSQLFYNSLGALLSAFVFLLIRERNIRFFRETSLKNGLLGTAGGVLFFMASLGATLSYSYLPASIAFTIIQLNAVWTVLAGVIVFREIDLRKHWLKIVVGILFAFAGVAMLLLAQ